MGGGRQDRAISDKSIIKTFAGAALAAIAVAWVNFIYSFFFEVFPKTQKDIVELRTDEKSFKAHVKSELKSLKEGQQGIIKHLLEGAHGKK